MRKSQRMGRKEGKLVETISIIDEDSPSPTSVSMKARSNLIEQEADMIKRGFLADSPMILVDFPRRRRSKRKIRSKNATCMQNKLDSGAFECYFQNLWRSFSEDKKTSFTYLDCLWFELHRKSAYKAKVLTWIQKKDIFSKKYVLVPIVCWRHWSLLIFCHFGESTKSETRTPCMLLLDSLEKANPRRLEPDIRKFVLDIYKAEGRLETKDFIYQIPLLVPKVPQQRNGEECGSFVLYFINLFMESAPVTPLMKMHTLGHDFIPDPIHAGGLRYHGMAPLISHVYELGYMEAIAIPQTECFQGAIQFARSEGLIPAPEPTHAIAATIREALRCRETGESKVILTAMCGHGHFDLPSYDKYLQGNMVDLSFSEEKIQASLANVPQVLA